MIVIGDVHGKIPAYLNIINNTTEPTIQVGDMGIGFRGVWFPKALDKKHGFCYGNHDNPQLCKQHPNCLGDFGYLEDQEIFFLSGAWSIDREFRTPGISWWADEELSHERLKEAYQLYCEKKPEIVISHDFPISAKDVLIKNNGFNCTFNSRTNVFLEEMLKFHRPKLHIGGHHHKSFDQVIDGCRFKCLNELETFHIFP